METENQPEVSFDALVDKLTSAEPRFVENPDPEEPDEGKAPAETTDYDDEDGGDEPEDGEDEDGGDEPEGDDDPDDANDDPDGGDKGAGEEDPETEVEIGGEKKAVKLSELKHAFAAREVIAAQSKALDERNRAVETQGMYLAKLYDDRIAKATENYQKYANVDLFDAYRQLDTDDFNALKTAKESAEAEYATVQAEAQNFLNNAINTRQAFLREKAKHAIGVIRQAIPDWSDATYDKVRTYAVSQGMSQSDASEVVDPATVIMMHKAMLYDDAASKSKTVVKKATKAPKAVEPKAEAKSGNTASKATKALAKQARMSGDVDDVAEAFLAAHRSK